MKRIKFISAALLAAAALSLAGCSSPLKPSPAASPAPPAEAVKNPVCVTEYSRMGKVLKETHYDSLTGQLKHTVVYSYNDSGQPLGVKKSGPAYDTDRAVESYLYSGKLCTQKILYDDNGGTQEVAYMKYSGSALASEKVQKLAPAADGKGYSRVEEYREFNEDGSVALFTSSAPEDYSKNEYEYDESGRLLRDTYSHSSDGKTFRVYSVTEYEYDESGRLTAERRLNRSEEAEFIRLYSYEEGSDEPAKIEDFASAAELEAGAPRLQQLFEYDAAGRMTWHYTSDASGTTQIFCEYDPAGNLTSISESIYPSGNGEKRTTVTQTEYDSHSNPLKETVKRPDGVERVSFIREYTYYEDGKIKTCTDYDPYG